MKMALLQLTALMIPGHDLCCRASHIDWLYVHVLYSCIRTIVQVQVEKTYWAFRADSSTWTHWTTLTLELDRRWTFWHRTYFRRAFQFSILSTTIKNFLKNALHMITGNTLLDGWLQNSLKLLSPADCTSLPIDSPLHAPCPAAIVQLSLRYYIGS